MRFKEYNQNKQELFPYTFDDFIPQNDPVRIVDSIVEQLDLRKLLNRYKNVGCPGYHPKMMMKIIIYAYLRNTFHHARSKILPPMISVLCGLQVCNARIITR